MTKRAHKIMLPLLGNLAFKLNSELDKGSFLPIDEAIKAGRDGKVITLIREKLSNGRLVDCLDREDEITISEYFDGLAVALCPEDLGVHKNGICWLLACTIEMMQKEEWSTF